MTAVPNTRPLRDLLHRLPLLPVADGRIDYEAADAAVLLQLAEDAETVLNLVNLGLSAVGTVLAHASVEVGSEIGPDTVEALGWLIAEAADLAAALLPLATACRHHTADYSPRKSAAVPPVRF